MNAKFSLCLIKQQTNKLCGWNVVQLHGLFNSTVLLPNRASLLPLDRNFFGPQGLSRYGDEVKNICPQSYQLYSLSVDDQLILIFHESWHSTEKVKKAYRRQMESCVLCLCKVRHIRLLYLKLPINHASPNIIIISNLWNDRSKASSKTIPPHSAIYSFLLQLTVSSPVLRSSSSILRLLPRLLFTSICPFIFPSISCCRRQFQRKMWPIQLAFRFLISCRILRDNIKINFQQVGWRDMDWIDVAQDRERWRAVVNAAMNLPVL